MGSESVESGACGQDLTFTLDIDSSGDLLKDLQLENGYSFLLPFLVVVIQDSAGDDWLRILPDESLQTLFECI